MRSCRVLSTGTIFPPVPLFRILDLSLYCAASIYFSLFENSLFENEGVYYLADKNCRAICKMLLKFLISNMCPTFLIIII